MIRLIKQKDFSNFFMYLGSYPQFNVKDIKQIFNKCIKHGDVAFIYEDNSIIKGILLVTKIEGRKRLQIFADNKIANFLIKYMTWNIYEPMFVTTPKYSPLVRLFNKFSYNKYKAEKYNLSGFQFAGMQNKDIAFNFIPSKKESNNRFIKEEDKYESN